MITTSSKQVDTALNTVNNVNNKTKEEVSVDDDYDDLPELINVEAEEEVEAEAVEVVKEKQE